jgi:hypothetical protein
VAKCVIRVILYPHIVGGIDVDDIISERGDSTAYGKLKVQQAQAAALLQSRQFISKGVRKREGASG